MKWLLFIGLLVLIVILVKSCGVIDFGGGIKIPSFLIYAAVFIGAIFYLLRGKK